MVAAEAARAPLEILLVEDNPADVRMTREALLAVGVGHRLHVVEDGEAALAFMRRDAGFGEAPRPDLVLLDLSLPRMSGHEVLAAMRRLKLEAHVPVVVLTGSPHERDLAESFALEADEHIRKPPSLGQLSSELAFALNLAQPAK